MPLLRFIDIDGRRYLWRDLVALRRAQATPPAQQPTLFVVQEDSVMHRKLREALLWSDCRRRLTQKHVRRSLNAARPRDATQRRKPHQPLFFPAAFDLQQFVL
jgi:hypothetical protein